MPVKQAQKYRVGQRVEWKSSPGTVGRIVYITRSEIGDILFGIDFPHEAGIFGRVVDVATGRRATELRSCFIRPANRRKR